jgi:hypothetical protein
VERSLAGLNNGKIGKPLSLVNLANLFRKKTSISVQKNRAAHSRVLVTTSDGKKIPDSQRKRLREIKLNRGSRPKTHE